MGGSIGGVTCGCVFGWMGVLGGLMGGWICSVDCCV